MDLLRILALRQKEGRANFESSCSEYFDWQENQIPFHGYSRTTQSGNDDEASYQGDGNCSSKYFRVAEDQVQKTVRLWKLGQKCILGLFHETVNHFLSSIMQISNEQQDLLLLKSFL